MFSILCFVLLYPLATTSKAVTMKPKSVNLAVETVLEFDRKSISSDMQIIDNVQKFLAKVRSILDKTSKGSRRSLSEHMKFINFVENTLLVLKTYNDFELEDLIRAVDNEFRKYHYKGCKFYELVENREFRIYVADTLDGLRGITGSELRQMLVDLLTKIKKRSFNRQEKELVEYINTLYPTDSAEHMYNVLNSLQQYKTSRRTRNDLAAIVRDGIRSIVFDHYSKLNNNARKDLKLKIATYFIEYSPLNVKNARSNSSSLNYKVKDKAINPIPVMIDNLRNHQSESAADAALSIDEMNEKYLGVNLESLFPEKITKVVTSKDQRSKKKSTKKSKKKTTTTRKSAKTNYQPTETPRESHFQTLWVESRIKKRTTNRLSVKSSEDSSSWQPSIERISKLKMKPRVSEKEKKMKSRTASKSKSKMIVKVDRPLKEILTEHNAIIRVERSTLLDVVENKRATKSHKRNYKKRNSKLTSKLSRFSSETTAKTTKKKELTIAESAEGLAIESFERNSLEEAVVFRKNFESHSVPAKRSNRKKIRKRRQYKKRNNHNTNNEGTHKRRESTDDVRLTTVGTVFTQTTLNNSYLISKIENLEQQLQDFKMRIPLSTVLQDFKMRIPLSTVLQDFKMRIPLSTVGSPNATTTTVRVIDIFGFPKFSNLSVWEGMPRAHEDTTKQPKITKTTLTAKTTKSSIYETEEKQSKEAYTYFKKIATIEATTHKPFTIGSSSSAITYPSTSTTTTRVSTNPIDSGPIFRSNDQDALAFFPKAEHRNKTIANILKPTVEYDTDTTINNLKENVLKNTTVTKYNKRFVTTVGTNVSQSKQPTMTTSNQTKVYKINNNTKSDDKTNSNNKIAENKIEPSINSTKLEFKNKMIPTVATAQQVMSSDSTTVKSTGSTTTINALVHTMSNQNGTESTVFFKKARRMIDFQSPMNFDQNFGMDDEDLRSQMLN